MPSPADELESLLPASRAALLAIPDEAAAAPTAPGRWSRNETLRLVAEDYVRHLRHHLAQILPPRPGVR